MLTLLLASVFLNGVNIDTLRSQKFEKCSAVRIDERGDIHLECPGYQVEGQAAPPPVAAPAPAAVSGAITRRYWLVTEEKDGAATQYEVDVFVNGKFLRKIRAGEPQVAMEITRDLHPGVNKVMFASTKKMDGGRRSVSPQSWLKLVVGEGEVGGGTITIDNPLFETRRTAADTDNLNEEFTLQGR
ncbi:MAG TPA: hypothetical protein VMK66_14560 [Myxococcales bacterium]|nr:hypothetical protein [Myxococcales bacterium]